MWNSDKSAKLSLIITYLFIVLLALLLITLPWLASLYADYTGKSDKITTTVMCVCYTCSPFAVVLLFSLRKLLINIIGEKVFIEENVKLLRRISWCCVFAAIIMLIAGAFYNPFFITGVAAGFIALIVRIIKNVFCSAIEIKAENDMTI